MTFEEFREYLQAAYRARQSASPRQQDLAFNALFRALDSRNHHYYPPLFYEQSLTLLHCYLDQVLPRLEYDPDDRQALVDDYRDLILAVEKHSATAQKIWADFERLLEQLRQGEIVHFCKLADSFAALAECFFGLRKFTESHSFGSLQDELRLLQENFNFTQAVTLFQRFFDQARKKGPKPSDERIAFYHCTSFFKAVLDAYFQEKAVLVDNFRHGHVIPLDITVDSRKSSAQVEFWNQHIDPGMQASADTARRIAHQYLLEEYGKELPEKFSVQCCFPENDVKFTDGSAGLLLGIRIVAAVLGMKGRTATLVSGEVGENGRILKVGFINEKLEAARQDKGIDRIIIPEANIPELSDPSVGSESEVIPVRSFAEAVRQALEHHVEDWGEAPLIQDFCGREVELMTLRERILDDACRFVPILGMGGIGKTALARKLTGQIANRFQYVFWRDLRNAPAAGDVLGDCVKFLSEQRDVDLPKTPPQRVSLVLRYLKEQRCLLVLDNLETILQIDEQCCGGVCFQEEFQDYGLFIQQVATSRHQSCLILTSREFPAEFLGLIHNGKVGHLHLQGLQAEDAACLLAALDTTKASRIQLIENYGGHPLALRLVAAIIRDHYHGDIAMFFQDQPPLFSSIEHLLKEQYALLSKQERDILFWLAIEREAVSLEELRNNIVSPFLQRELPRTIEVLRQKSLIESTADGFILQPVILEYITARLVHMLCREILKSKSCLLQSHALLKTHAKEYIRHSQIRFILQGVVDILEYEYEFDRQDLEERLHAILDSLREKFPPKPGYAVGNILNFLLFLNADLQGCDLSNLPVWQASLQGAELHHVNLANADLRGTVFTETFGNLLSVDYSHDGKFLAAGTLSKEIRIWDTTNYQQIQNCTGHSGWVWSVAFSPDGQMLASGSHDRGVRLWDVKSGNCLLTLEGHSSWPLVRMELCWRVVELMVLSCGKLGQGAHYSKFKTLIRQFTQ